MGQTPPLSDEDYLALCVWDEARGESPKGQQAVAEVVLNRELHKVHSDGTIRGTVLAKDQFSGFYFDMVDGRYQRICHDMDAADLQAHRLLIKAATDREWAGCILAARRALDNVGPSVILPTDAVLYYNPAVVHAPPAWATTDKYVTTIGHHAFYRA